MYPLGKYIYPLGILPRRKVVRSGTIIVWMTLPGVYNTIISSGGSNRCVSGVAESKILSDKFQYLDISETTSSRSGSITGRTGRSILIEFKDPAKIGTFGFQSFFYQIELFCAHSTGKDARTHTEIFIVIISSNVVIIVLVSEVIICIGIVIDELLTILPVSLSGSRSVHATSGSHRYSHSTHTGVKSVPII